jgi:hypothetical protein
LTLTRGQHFGKAGGDFYLYVDPTRMLWMD